MGLQSAKSIERTHLGGALEDVGELPIHLKADEAAGALRVLLMVYDTDLLQAVKLPLSAFDQADLTTSMNDIEKALVENYWKDQRFDYVSNSIKYRGLNVTHKAAADATTWYIWKYTYDNGNVTRIEGPLVGAWDNRASLSWG